MTKPFLVWGACLCVLGFLSSCSSPKDTPPWQPLFNGSNFDNWTQLGGEAIYEIQGQEIVGITVSHTPNSFLTTTDPFGDFILEFSYWVDPSMNSGVQIRSQSLPYYMQGRVHGYQVEIDPSERAWSGGIYDEARRGWLVPLDQNPAAQAAFKQNDWNHYRIEAIGDTIKTWINGVAAAHLIDSYTSSGFIGLQVHSIEKNQKPGTQIRWKDLKILTQNLDQYSRAISLAPVVTKNKLLAWEKEQGWELLWDGHSTQGWRGAKQEGFPEQGWEIKNGELSVLASDGAESAAGGDIVTQAVYDNFELKLDFKLTKGANSGIKYYVDTQLNKGAGSAIGLEYQLLDDANHPDALLGSQPGSRTLGSLYDLMAADTLKPAYPVGQWNTAHIIAKDQQLTHFLNGYKILSYDRSSPEFSRLVAQSKYRIWEGFGTRAAGPILLQDHGNRVSFKNIKIKPYRDE